MPVFEIQSQDGKTFEIDAPDAAAAQKAWEGLNQPTAMQTAGGLYKSFDAGVAKGAAGLVGLPNTIGDLGAKGMDWLGEKIAGGLGQEYKRPNVGGPLKGILPTAEGAQGAIERTIYGGKPLYQPQTQGERYANTIGEFVPGAVLAPGGVIGNTIRYGALPGAASEFAGEQTKGTAYETPARVGAAIATGGVAGATARNTTAQAIRNNLPPGVTPQMVDQAQTLMTEARNMGVTLSWPEAMSQVAGRPVLSNTMRHLEAAGPTEARMAEFYGQRPQQVEQAGRAQFDNIAPVNNAPSTIGPQAGALAETTVNDVRGAINNAARPHYRNAEAVLLDPAEMAQVRALPGYAEASRAVRGDPQLNRYVSHLPEESVGFLNEVKKYLDTASTNAAAPVNMQRNMQRSAGYGADAATARTIGQNASPDYATALAVESAGRQRFLEPLLQGPIGKIASKDTATKQAINALFPTNPLPNSADEITTAVGALASRSPRVATDLVRAHVESTFNEATQALQSGANQAGGAKFAAVLAGNPQQRANLEAAITALPNGADRWAGFNRFLEVLEATGTRQNIGSKTAYNADFLRETGASSIAGEIAKGASNPVSRFTQGLVDKYERWNLGRNLNELADILTNPAAVTQLRAIARMPVNSPQALNIAWRLTNMSQPAGAPPVQQPRQ